MSEENVLVRMFKNEKSQFKTFCNEPSFNNKMMLLINKQKGKGVKSFIRDHHFDGSIRNFSKDHAHKFDELVTKNFMSYSKNPNENDLKKCDQEFKEKHTTLFNELKPLFDGGCNVFDIGMLLNQYKDRMNLKVDHYL